MILTKIELGEVDPDDPLSGIQYGDNLGVWTGAGAAAEDAGSIKSALSVAEGDAGVGPRRRRGGGRGGSGSAMRQWGQVFRLDGRGRRNCC